MQKNTAGIVYDKNTGMELFTSKEAARFLHYHPVAFRHLVSTGKIRVHSRAGNYPLFIREELEKYQLTNKWAGKKAKIKTLPNPPPAPTGKKGILAVVTASYKKKDVVLEKLNNFKWDDVPAIRAKVASKHGRIPFQINLELPDGTAFTINFHTSTTEAEAHKTMARNAPKPLWGKRKDGTAWLIG
ncbi:MAG: hypothetical protein BWY65_01859 [Firmicutes bacterium ADurb.Bin373]|nr:MAG: hypothetical protein BWY65_01859 [Firmicutes bacterium ADurb.Bin373]